MSSLPLLSTVCGAVALAACVAIHGCWCLCRSLRLVVSVLVSWAVGVCVGIYDCWCQQSCIAITRAVSIALASPLARNLSHSRALSLALLRSLCLLRRKDALNTRRGGLLGRDTNLVIYVTLPLHQCAAAQGVCIHSVTCTRSLSHGNKMHAQRGQREECPHAWTKRGMATWSDKERNGHMLRHAMAMLSLQRDGNALQGDANALQRDANALSPTRSR